MSYYPTIEEDLQRAKAILAKATPGEGAAIYGGDTFAAYKLLESFVEEIEDYERSFELYHRASMALMHVYKRAHSMPENVWPDAAAVSEWAAEEIETLKADRDFWDTKAGEEHATVNKFYRLFSDYEEPCQSYEQAESIWNDLKDRWGKAVDVWKTKALGLENELAHMRRQILDVQRRAETAEQIAANTPCDTYRPDANGECLNCDEPASAHLDEAIRERDRQLLAAIEAQVSGDVMAPGRKGQLMTIRDVVAEVLGTLTFP